MSKILFDYSDQNLNMFYFKLTHLRGTLLLLFYGRLNTVQLLEKNLKISKYLCLYSTYGGLHSMFFTLEIHLRGLK